jgi:LPS export ABC transporter protein LptC
MQSKVLCFCIFLFSACSNDPKIVETFVSSKNLPSETIKEAELIYTEKGKVKVKIIAKKIERYTATSIINFSEGIVVHFYNDSAIITSTLTAQEASIDEKKEQMMAQVNVELVNQKQEKLNTEQLIWDEKSNLIFTEKLVKITTKDEIIFGEGFESTPDFSSYKITNVRGSINIKDINDTLN